MLINPGQGTRARVPGVHAAPQTFDPVVDARREGRASGADAAEQRLLRVLFVDDDQDTVASFAVLARLWGHDVRVACRGTEALELAEAYQPDVALLDVAMPGMDGYMLARRLR